MVAIDRQKREHIATVRKIVFHSPTDDYVIIALGDENTAKGRQPPAFFAQGTRYRFLGRWAEGRKGPEFLFDSIVVDAPLTRVGVIRYLVKVAPNVGERTAEKLFGRYGPDAVQVLRESPGRVSEDGVMSLAAAVEAAQALNANVRLERTRVELFGLFSGRGFHGAAIEAAIKKWGAKAPDVVRRNPFACLLAKLPGAGFKRCDKFWLDVGKPAAGLKRQMLCGWNWMRVDGSGHTWWAVEEVGQAIRKAIDSANVNPVKAMTLGKRSGWLRFRRDADGKIWVAESDKAAAEQRVADSIHRLSAWSGAKLWPADLAASQSEGDGLPSPHQRANALRATTGPIGILAGSPGTGKTHTLAFILRDVIDRIGAANVAACAPTGKAAVRATQSLALRGIDLRATTIHRLLGIGKNGHADGDWGFIHNRDNPLPYRVLIVDEGSMIDTSLFASLLDACADGTHVLIVGDPYQLPPVGHGAPLRDLIAAGVPCGELSEVRRNAGQIVHACLRIKNGEDFEATDRLDLAAGKNLLFVDTRNEDESIERLEGILANAQRFHPVTQTQVILGLNKRSVLSRVPVNDRLQKLLNPDGRSAGSNPFRIGDKVICLRNSSLQMVDACGELDPESLQDPKNYDPVLDDEGEPKEVYVANGEIGFVVAVSESLMIARVGEEDYCVKVPVGKQRQPAAGQDGGDDGSGPQADEDGRATDDGSPKGRGCNFDLAYAITVHKSQGSESPCVIVLIDPRAGMIADRNFWYTAISRASKACVLIGQRGVIDKQCKKQSLVRRKTFLRELIVEQGAGDVK